MKHFLMIMLLMAVSLFAEVKNQYIDQKLIDSGVQIVDIRTPGEWKQTGLVKGSIPIMFFDERGKYDIPLFLTTLNKKVDTKKEFALICRTGSRTKTVANFLSQEYGYKIINLQGGIMYGLGKNIPVSPYKGP